MAFQETNKMMDTMVENQKKVIDTMVENTKKITGNTPMSETIEKGTDWYKNWLDQQKNTLSNMTNTQANNTENHTENNHTHNASADFFNQWMNMQMNFAKQMWEAAQNNKMFDQTNMQNPMSAWMKMMPNNMSNMQNPMNAWMNMMPNNWTNWMGNMQQQNPFNNNMMKQAGDTMQNMFSQFMNMMQTGMGEWQKGFQNVTVEDAYKNMVSTGEGFMKFAQMWAPMFEAMQNNTFNMDMYKQYMNPAMYKEFMDKFFGFLPEGFRHQMENMGTNMKDNMRQMNEAGMKGYHQMRGMMNNMMPAQDMFHQMQNGYNQWYAMMQEAASPFAKMATPNQYTKAAAEWNDITNRITEYNMKNAELQFMIYQQGTKVMDTLAENVAKKMQEGTEIKSMLALYQEWLNMGDKVFVALFESDEYSQLMAEVSSMQHRLRKDIDAQIEKMMKDIPVATRSEMDEMYKMVYDLKKQIRQMHKMLDLDEEVKPEETKTAKSGKSKK